MARTTEKTVVGVRQSEAEQAAHDYAKISNRIDKLTADMNDKITAIREKYEPEITELTQDLEEPKNVLKSYAIEQRGSWSKKSIELFNCEIGFRTNPPSVTKDRKTQWAFIVGLMKKNRLLKAFVRVKEDVDKEAILKLRDDAKYMKAVNGVGIRIEQDEVFFVEAKKAEPA